MEQIKTKVLIIQNSLLNYRIPVYTELAKRNGIDLTLMHSGNYMAGERLNFKIKFLEIKKTGKFIFHKTNLFKIAQNYDVVIGMPDPHWLSIISLVFYNKRKYKLIFWGIGVTASYTKGYDTGGLGDRIRNFIFKRSDAVLFYSAYPKEKYIHKGMPKNKIFIANNTTNVLESNFDSSKKNNILFIGTLYKQKKIYDLLEAYFLASKTTNIKNKLIIIGNGPEKEEIEMWIKNNSLVDKIVLLGSVFDEKTIRKEFEEAIACISPGQAGLSVLKSMGYGVPFITSKKAITGGEIFNIKNGENGLLYSRNEELTRIIIDISNNKDKYLTLGRNAFSFYKKERTVKQMVDGFVDSINFVSSK